MTDSSSDFERRKHQRFVARRRGEVCFWISFGSERLPLMDISIDGFSVSDDAGLSLGQELPFELSLDFGDRIRGRTKVVNALNTPTGKHFGCCFTEFEGTGATQLKEWLTIHVMVSATVRISAAEAEKIVSGPSLV